MNFDLPRTSDIEGIRVAQIEDDFFLRGKSYDDAGQFHERKVSREQPGASIKSSVAASSHVPLMTNPDLLDTLDVLAELVTPAPTSVNDRTVTLGSTPHGS